MSIVLEIRYQHRNRRMSNGACGSEKLISKEEARDGENKQRGDSAYKRPWNIPCPWSYVGETQSRGCALFLPLVQGGDSFVSTLVPQLGFELQTLGNH